MNSSKKLHELSTKELGKLFPIIISDYSENWILFYQKEKTLIESYLNQSDIVSIDHIGSTSIPGLKAKPTIDILLQVSSSIDIEKLQHNFISNGYHCIKQPVNPSPHITFVKGYTEEGFKGQAYHVHVRYKGDWDEIHFRNFLIQNEDLANEYESLKIKLAKKYKYDREGYTNSKTEFIKKIMILSRG